MKIASILMIIGGILGVVGSVFMAMLSAGVMAIGSNPELQKIFTDVVKTTKAVSAVLWVGVAVLVISSVIEIIAGIKGKKNCNNPAMGKTLLVWGIVTAVVSVVGNVLYASADTASNAIVIASCATGLVIPVLYIIGAVKLKNQAQTE